MHGFFGAPGGGGPRPTSDRRGRGERSGTALEYTFLLSFLCISLVRIISSADLGWLRSGRRRFRCACSQFTPSCCMLPEGPWQQRDYFLYTTVVLPDRHRRPSGAPLSPSSQCRRSGDKQRKSDEGKGQRKETKERYILMGGPALPLLL